jgi:mono/diheme cytochrome c family protein
VLVSTFRTAQVLVVGADGKLGTRLVPGAGPVPTILGTTQTRTPSVAWRMVPMDASTNSVLMLHQTGVTDTIELAPGGYAGLSNCGGIVQPGLSVLAPGKPGPAVASGLGALTLAIDVALSPDHQKVALAVAGNSPAQGPTLVEKPLQSAAATTDKPCPDLNNDVLNPPPGQVVAVSYSPSGVLFAQTREPAALWRSDTGATISLAADPRTDTGHFVFHANSGGGLACASCHPEGGEDGRVWTFVCIGARRTQSMRGGISATAPFHWDGGEIDLPRLMDDVFSGRMAGPLLSDDQKSALQAWIDTVPAMPSLAGLDAAAVTRGKALFEDAKVGCASCHGGALLTNNMTVDVGTGRAFQVPSLRGVAWRAPFMHDGCAATLADRFRSASCGGGDKHGVTSTLTSAQLGDLTAYLQSL